MPLSPIIQLAETRIPGKLDTRGMTVQGEAEIRYSPIVYRPLLTQVPPGRTPLKSPHIVGHKVHIRRSHRRQPNTMPPLILRVSGGTHPGTSRALAANHLSFGQVLPKKRALYPAPLPGHRMRLATHRAKATVTDMFAHVSTRQLWWHHAGVSRQFANKLRRMCRNTCLSLNRIGGQYHT